MLRIKVFRAAVFRTAAFRLALLQALLFGVFATALLGLVWQGINHYAEAQLREAVKAEMASLLQAAGDGTLTAQLQQRIAVMPLGPNYYLLTDGRGQRLLGNLTWQPNGPGWHTVALHSALGEDNSDADSVHLFMTRLADGRYLVAGSDNRSIIELGEVLSGRFLDVGGIVILLVLLSGGLVSRHYLKRIDALGERAERILEGEQGLVISSSGRDDEFDRLAANLNGMLDQIERLMTGMREVTDNVAHDLKTPLARLRARLELTLLGPTDEAARADAIRAAIDEADRLLATFNALLSITEAESGAGRDRAETLDLGELARAAAELYEPVAEEQGFVLKVDTEPGVSISGHRHLLSQAIANLLDNALKYGGGGAMPGEIRLSVRQDNGRAALEVCDRGAGIPEAEREAVFGRFVRLEPSRSTPGNGLGLSLVRAAARLHDATVTLSDNAPGLKVRLEFPALAG